MFMINVMCKLKYYCFSHSIFSFVLHYFTCMKKRMIFQPTLLSKGWQNVEKLCSPYHSRQSVVLAFQWHLIDLCHNDQRHLSIVECMSKDCRIQRNLLSLIDLCQTYLEMNWVRTYKQIAQHLVSSHKVLRQINNHKEHTYHQSACFIIKLCPVTIN